MQNSTAKTADKNDHSDIPRWGPMVLTALAGVASLSLAVEMFSFVQRVTI